MYPQNHYLTAIETVLGQGFPDEALPAAIASQAAVLSRNSQE